MCTKSICRRCNCKISFHYIFWRSTIKSCIYMFLPPFCKGKDSAENSEGCRAGICDWKRQYDWNSTSKVVGFLALFHHSCVTGQSFVLCIFFYSAFVGLLHFGSCSINRSRRYRHWNISLVCWQLWIAQDTGIRRGLCRLPRPPPHPMDHHISILREQCIQDCPGHDTCASTRLQYSYESVRKIVFHFVH